jgi:sulfite exporter TauE/SafE
MVSETIIPTTYLEALTIGLLYGTIFCTSECLPYLASYIAGTGAGIRKGTVITLIYNSGRLISYTLIGVIVALVGGSVTQLLTEATLASFTIYSSYAFGIINILIGLHILLKIKKNYSNCAKECKSIDEWKIARNDFGAFTLGLSRGLIICPPLFALLVFSVPFSTPLDSIALAVLFGLGTTLSPMLVLGGVTGWLLNKAPLFRKWISIFGSGALIVLGIGAILLAILLPN